ncbi:MAG: type II secretion system protein [Verrucomicrobiota bacterium]
MPVAFLKASSRSATAGRSSHGFTLVEMLAVVAIIALVLSFLMPALVKSRNQARGIFCMNNLQQIQLAWTMYAGDHEEYLPAVTGGSFPGLGKWVSGWLDFSSSPDNTNTLYLLDPRYAQLGIYVKSEGPFHCPADLSTVWIDGKLMARVRSISMNCWMNYVGVAPIGQDEFRVFRKLDEITDPSPARAWVFMDEREDSINDGMFQTNLKDRWMAAKIVDYPASHHNGAAGIVFADGHAEMKHWRDQRTIPEIGPSQTLLLNVASPDNPDVAWLQDHSSSPLK